MRPSRTERWIGVYQSLAGGYGLVLVALSVGRIYPKVPPGSRGEFVAIWAAITLLFTMVTLAGVALLRGHALGRPVSTIVQLIQVFIVATKGVHWIFLAGLYLGVTVFDGTVRPMAGFRAQAQVAYGKGPPPMTGMGVNIIPFGVLWLLWRRRTEGTVGRAPPGSARANIAAPAA